MIIHTNVIPDLKNAYMIRCIQFLRYKGCFNVINVRVNRVSTILSHTHLAINGLHCHIGSK